MLSHSTLHSQPHNGEMIQNCLEQGQLTQTSHANGMQALLLNILSGFTQEEINNSEQLKVILTKLGLDADQIADLLSMQADSPQGESKEAFLARLLGALEEKGILPDQAKDISQMLVALKVEKGSQPSTQIKPDSVLKDILVQMGVSPEEAQKSVEEGELSVTGLKKILAQLGLETEGVDKVVKGEKVLLGDLKNVLEQLGVKPGNLNALIAVGKHGNPESLPKGLLEIFDKVLNNQINANSLAVALQEDMPAGDNSSGRQDSAGNGDLKGEGQLALGATGGKTVSAVGQERGDFEQMMSRINSRGPVAQKVVEQIVEGARFQVENGQTKAKIFLQPPSLGKLNLQIITRENQVKVTFFAENSQVKEIIENNLSQLRQSFVEQGLRVDNFDVFVDYQPSGQPDGQDNPFGSFRAHREENGKPDFEEGDAPGGSRRWLSGNHRIDLFV
jgi:flagellar hook-length control protein FliK